MTQPCSRRVAIHLTLALLLPNLLVTAPLLADSTATVEVERVALFKNGYAFLTHRATLPDDATVIELAALPEPTHGTLWIDHPASLPLKGLFARQRDFPIERSPAEMSGMLALNTGHRVLLEPGGIDGTVETVLGQTLAIRTAEGLTMIPLGAVERATLLGPDIVASETLSETRPVLQLELDRPSPGTEIAVTHLARGLSWAPSYRIDLSHPSKARVDAKAVVLNETLDLENVQLDLVTGFPHLQFAEVFSPLGPSQNLDRFFQALHILTNTHRQPSALTSQVVLNQAARYVGTSTEEPATAPQSMTAEDLHLMSVGRVTLRQGEKALLPLFSVMMPYQHIYTWDIPDLLGSNQTSYGHEPKPDTDTVWHSVRLTNTAGQPLTTAPATFVRDGALVGQDTLHFTPSTANTTVRINKALGIEVDQREIEVRRDPDLVRVLGDNYHRVTIRGELEIRNHLGKPVRFELTKRCSGELSQALGEPERVQETQGLRSANTSHRLLWKLDLAADDTIELGYEHTILVRY